MMLGRKNIKLWK